MIWSHLSSFGCNSIHIILYASHSGSSIHSAVKVSTFTCYYMLFLYYAQYSKHYNYANSTILSYFGEKYGALIMRDLFDC